MNIITGEIVEIYLDNGIRMAKVRVGGAYMRVLLTFLPEVRVGDQILIESGVAISKIEREQRKESQNVLSNSRKSVRN